MASGRNIQIFTNLSCQFMLLFSGYVVYNIIISNKERIIGNQD